MIITDIEKLPKAEAVDMYFRGQFVNSDMPGRTKDHPVPKKKAIINPDTGEVYSVASQFYKFVSHQEAIERVLDIVKGNPEFGEPKLSINTYQNGAKMQARICFPETEFKITTTPQGIPDTVNPEIWIKNSYDFVWLYKVDFGGNRKICTNGMRAFSTLAYYMAKHVTSLDMSIMERNIKHGIAHYTDQIEAWREWSKKTTEPEEYIEKMEMMKFPEYHENEIHKEVEMSSGLMLSDIKVKTLSYWNFYNIVTQYVEHKLTGISQANAQAKLGNF